MLATALGNNPAPTEVRQDAINAGNVLRGMDNNGDGIVSRQEFAQGLTKMGGTNKLLQTLDLNGDGRVTTEEAKAAVVAFADKNGDGKLDASEKQALMRNTGANDFDDAIKKAAMGLGFALASKGAKFVGEEAVVSTSQVVKNNVARSQSNDVGR